MCIQNNQNEIKGLNQLQSQLEEETESTFFTVEQLLKIFNAFSITYPKIYNSTNQDLLQNFFPKIFQTLMDTKLLKKSNQSERLKLKFVHF